MQYEKCMARSAFKEPMQRINEHYMRLDMLVKMMQHGVTNIYNENKNKMIATVSKLDSLSPLKTLTRGYCITQANGKIVKSVKEIAPQQEISLRFIDGERNAKVLD